MQVGRLLAGRSLMRSPRSRMSPLVGCVHAGQHAQHGRLAGARRSDDGEELAFRDVEVDRVHGRVRPEHLADGFQGQDGLAVGHQVGKTFMHMQSAPAIARGGRVIWQADDQPPEASRLAAVMMSSSLS
jgi:hypothetical protein